MGVVTGCSPQVGGMGQSSKEISHIDSDLYSHNTIARGLPLGILMM